MGDIRRLILDEPTHTVDSLPRGMCQGDLKDRFYTNLHDSLFTCSTDLATDIPTEAPSDVAPSEPATDIPTEIPSDEVTTDPVTQTPSVLEAEEDDESFASQI